MRPQKLTNTLSSKLFRITETLTTLACTASECTERCRVLYTVHVHCACTKAVSVNDVDVYGGDNFVSTFTVCHLLCVIS
jgi:hypothetical protein